jgi:transposase-like protein
VEKAMASSKEIGYIAFQKQYSTEEDCRKRLFEIRFPIMFICPKCGCVEYYSIPTRNLYQCKGCHYQLSVTAGTVMHHSHLPLLTWFWAIYLVSKDKRGCSATQLAKELGLPYNTAWFLLHRIRSAMTQRDEEYQLSGIVELDDTYFGKPKKGGKRGRGTKKIKVIVAVSKTEDGKPRYIKMKVVSNLKSTTIGKFASQNIVEGSKIETDAYHSYRKPLAEKYDHHFEVFDPSSDELHWLHIMIGNAKAFVNGTFHGLGDKHLQRYLDEFCYRFNRRYFKRGIFDRLLIAVTSASPLTFAELT